jgi:ribose transport system ATP-binding protein
MSSPSSGVPLVQVEGLVKSFPGVRALRGVSLHVMPGEIVSVIGENGAGKSTLMKILAGVQMQDQGSVRIDGKEVAIHSVEAAQKLGIALIHQELNLAENLDVAANIYLGREPTKWGMIDSAKMRRDSIVHLQCVGLKVSPSTLVGKLAPGQKQLVEIAKALSANAKLIIMDEPTSSLSTSEVERLYEVIADLKSCGVAIVYISHRLGEVKRISDRVVVLRDGSNAGELAKEEITHDNMVRRMVGRDLSQFYQRKPHPAGESALRLEGLVAPGRKPTPVSFQVRAGEIVGLYGLVGAGRTELLRVLFGIDRKLGGEIFVCDKRVSASTPYGAISAGMVLVPEDRKAQGLIVEQAVRENSSLPSIFRDSLACMLSLKKEATLVRDAIAKLRIKTPSSAQIAKYLSGGNQQKIVLGKWLAMQPKVLLLDEPTRGVDIGAKQEIYGIIDELASRGVAVLFVTSEMEELLGMSDRILVMHESRITGELSREKYSEENVMRLATGQHTSTADSAA